MLHALQCRQPQGQLYAVQNNLYIWRTRVRATKQGNRRVTGQHHSKCFKTRRLQDWR